jgi:hypothetical protein
VTTKELVVEEEEEAFKIEEGLKLGRIMGIVLFTSLLLFLPWLHGSSLARMRRGYHGCCHDLLIWMFSDH